MIDRVYAETEHKMQKAIEVLKKELAAIRTGRASPALLEQIRVDYYGVPTPVTQVATINVPEPRLLVIQPWDKGMVSVIEKAIMRSDLGLNPSSDGTVIRLAIPPLTEERRRELVRLVHKEAEQAKVAIRNIRRDAVDELKKLEKSGAISEDDLRRAQERIEKLTHNYVAQVDQLAKAKENEVLEV